MPTIVIADDHELVRYGVRALLRSDSEVRIVAEASNGIDALRMVEQHHPDILILDIGMPMMGGIEVTREVSRISRRTQTIILSMHAAESYVVEALRNGAAGYVLKDSHSSELLDAIRHVRAGRRYLSASVSQRAIDAYLENIQTELDPYETLTARERQIFLLIAEGLSNAEIAERLYISARTVESHRANLMKKLGLKSHTELIVMAVRRGLLKIA